MPDALSKTAPIWCAVFNRVFFPTALEAHRLRTPPHTVSESEHSQIEGRIEGFVRQLESLHLDFDELKKLVAKPLRPIWVTRESDLPSTLAEFEDFLPVILCTSSRRVHAAEASEGGYVQGAGDDSEGWAHGLTAQLFWRHKGRLLATSEGDLPELIRELDLADAKANGGKTLQAVRPTSFLYVGSLSDLHNKTVTESDAMIICASIDESIGIPKSKGPRLLLPCAQGKLGSRDLRKHLPNLVEFFGTIDPTRRVLVACETGKDISVGVALALLCLYADDKGNLSTKLERQKIDKNLIRRRLGWIMTSIPSAKPSRATLQSVNAFLMSPLAASRSPPPVQHMQSMR